MSQYDGNGNTIGSYGFAINNLAAGLSIAVNEEFVTKVEARREFRSYVKTIIKSKNREKAIKELEDRLAEMMAADEDDPFGGEDSDDDD